MSLGVYPGPALFGGKKGYVHLTFSGLSLISDLIQVNGGRWFEAKIIQHETRTTIERYIPTTSKHELQGRTEETRRGEDKESRREGGAKGKERSTAVQEDRDQGSYRYLS